MKDSFKFEDVKKNKKHNRDLILIIVFLVIAIVSFIVYFILQKPSYISKINENKDYVYTVKKEINITSDNVIDKVPMINLNNKSIEKVNKMILSRYESVTKTLEYEYSYDYSVSKNILSLKINYVYFANENSKEATHDFDTYNIDLKTGSILRDDQLLSRFKLTEEGVNKFLEAKFNTYYNDVVNNEYFTKSECSYECFLDNHKLSTNYLENGHFYVKDGSLLFFKYYPIVTEYGEEDYFVDTSFGFLIKEA